MTARQRPPIARPGSRSPRSGSQLAPSPEAEWAGRPQPTTTTSPCLAGSVVRESPESSPEAAATSSRGTRSAPGADRRRRSQGEGGGPQLGRPRLLVEAQRVLDAAIARWEQSRERFLRGHPARSVAPCRAPVRQADPGLCERPLEHVAHVAWTRVAGPTGEFGQRWGAQSGHERFSCDHRQIRRAPALLLPRLQRCRHRSAEPHAGRPVRPGTDEPAGGRGPEAGTAPATARNHLLPPGTSGPCTGALRTFGRARTAGPFPNLRVTPPRTENAPSSPSPRSRRAAHWPRPSPTATTPPATSNSGR